ncbi:hypothetical protein H7564_001529 [Enterococcus faecalis]|uniref:hypothetical protein n=1 Tax=Enterococcus faecalis TaxID=1351 RepID=UPI0019DFC020|nr:hypothetical protein [Enterococcus faecalis]EGO5059589.1 hypothetical protein [Enterococcus faecalis]EHB6415847.1 hypothetical protein [Enterococcus faecalis]EHZ2983946.1 hypothetical protein [Enterococcus faecalis]EKZ0092955.1 hypothetical protein [Enterococcus faecalis]UQF29876.1 hypothetical protein M2913_08940 [Enterococcus faecalis]
MAKEKNEKKANSDKGEIKETNLKKCFFITPIGEKNSNEFKKLKAIVENVLNKVLEKYDYELIIAHEIHSMGSIGDQVFTNIIGADLVISNLSGWNANVMYETAVAHSFGKPTIMICESGTELPFDLINDRTIFFEDTIEGTGALIEELDKKIPKISEDSTADNPVTRVIRRKALEDDLKGETDNDSRILGLLLDMDKRLSMYEDSNIIEKKKINTGNIERIRAKIYYKNEGNINVIDELEGYLFEKYRDTVQIVSVTSGNRYEDRNSEVMKVIIVNSLYSPAKIFKDIEITLGILGMVDISVKVFP